MRLLSVNIKQRKVDIRYEIAVRLIELLFDAALFWVYIISAPYVMCGDAFQFCIINLSGRTNPDTCKIENYGVDSFDSAVNTYPIKPTNGDLFYHCGFQLDSDCRHKAALLFFIERRGVIFITECVARSISVSVVFKLVDLWNV